MNPKIYREESHGITQISLEYLKTHLELVEEIIAIRGFKDEQDEYWTQFIDYYGNTITLSGFSWGYGGEGPHGLLKGFEMVGWPMDMKLIIELDPVKGWETIRSPRTKEEKAQALGITATYDTALPQDWVNKVYTLINAQYGVPEGIKDDHPAGHFIWLYDEEAKMFGRPFPLTKKGKRILDFVRRNGVKD